MTPPFFWLGAQAEAAEAETETLAQLARELPSVDEADEEG